MSDKKLKKDAANPELAPKERKIKDLQSKIDAGTYKPDSAAIADKMVEGAKKEKTMKKDEMKGEQSEPGDMQMSENAKCKKCGKGEKLCKCLAMSEKADLCKNCGDLHKSTACMKGKSFKQMKDLEKTGEYQPHPGPSNSKHQNTYNAKKQAKDEAHLKSPKGEAERKKRNSEMSSKFKKSEVALSKSELQPGMSLNDLKKAEQGLMKAEVEAMSLAAEARAALDLVRSKLFPKK